MPKWTSNKKVQVNWTTDYNTSFYLQALFIHTISYTYWMSQ